MRPLSIRGKLLLVVIIAAVLPLVLAGSWLARGSVRAGEELLRSELAASLDRVAARATAAWEFRRSDLLLVGQNEPVRGWLGTATPSLAAADSARAYLQSMRSQLEVHFVSISLRDTRGNVRWTMGESDGQADRERGTNRFSLPEPASLGVRVPASDEYTDAPLGIVSARVRLHSLFGDSVIATVRNAEFAVRDRATGAVLRGDSVTAQRDERWVTQSRDLDEPAIRLTLSAPLAPFVDPYRRGARGGLLVLIAAALVAIALTGMLMARITRSLAALSEAADAVARGDLLHEVRANGDDDLGRVARAFNTMTSQLRTMLSQLAQREALAAVGQFAAVLAHEIRNGHTSIRLDLQRATKRLPEGERGKALVSRALERLTRLDRSVTGSLALARSGSVQVTELDLREPLESAVAAATADTVSIHTDLPAAPLRMLGNAGTLEQLFVNLLLNARDAAGTGGRVDLSLEVGAKRVRACVRDDGPGIPPDQLDQVFDPFFTTKRAGTGLGLAIARQIARAHGGDIRALPTRGGGAEFEVTLPLV
jgi:signal transduction histidine kinase